MSGEYINHSGKPLEKIKLLVNIFITFFLISPVTFGGGFAIIPVVERAVVAKRKWLDEKEVADIFTVSQTIPGAVGVNSATYIGLRLAGIPGALAAMLGIVIPSFVIILILSLLLASFKENPYVVAAFKGIKPVVVALIAYAGYRMARSALKDGIAWMLAVFSIGLLLVVKNLNIFFMILAGALAGVILCKIRALIAEANKANRCGKQEDGDNTGNGREDGKGC